MIKSELKRLERGAFELKVIVSKDEVDSVRELVITEMVKKAELPGFRKGSAPKDRVEPTLDKKAIYDEVVGKVIPRAYVESLKKHDLRPILNPRVQLIKVKEGEDWEFVATACEAPEVELGDYKAEAKKVLTTDALWVPGKGDPAKKESVDKDKQLNKVIDHLLTIISIDPAEMLIEEEVNHSLSRLVDQTQSLGITVEQYLASSGKTAEILKSEYRDSAKKNLQLEFLLNAIAKDLKIEVSDKEVDEVVLAAGDESLRQALNSPTQRSVIRAILSRRRALDTLLKFA